MPLTLNLLLLQEDDRKKRRPDISRAMKLLHWKPEACLGEGLKKTVDYFRDRLNKEGEK